MSHREWFSSHENQSAEGPHGSHLESSPEHAKIAEQKEDHVDGSLKKKRDIVMMMKITNLIFSNSVTCAEIPVSVARVIL